MHLTPDGHVRQRMAKIVSLLKMNSPSRLWWDSYFSSAGARKAEFPFAQLALEKDHLFLG